MEGLTHREQRFVHALIKLDGNQTQAALQAGYAKSGASTEGYRLLKKAHVANAVEEHRKLLAQASLLDGNDVIAGLLREATDFSDKSSSAARVSAWTQLGKHLKLFDSETSVIHTVDGDSIAKMMRSIAGRAHYDTPQAQIVDATPVKDGDK